MYAISLSVFGCDVPKNAELVQMPESSIIQYLYVELNELIGYTMKKKKATGLDIKKIKQL